VNPAADRHRFPQYSSRRASNRNPNVTAAAIVSSARPVRADINDPMSSCSPTAPIQPADLCRDVHLFRPEPRPNRIEERPRRQRVLPRNSPRQHWVQMVVRVHQSWRRRVLSQDNAPPASIQRVSAIRRRGSDVGAASSRRASSMVKTAAAPLIKHQAFAHSLRSVR
jgi:hypothetical protein